MFIFPFREHRQVSECELADGALAMLNNAHCVMLWRDERSIPQHYFLTADGVEVLGADGARWCRFERESIFAELDGVVGPSDCFAGTVAYSPCSVDEHEKWEGEVIRQLEALLGIPGREFDESVISLLENELSSAVRAGPSVTARHIVEQL